jgi:hypothetical protein
MILPVLQNKYGFNYYLILRVVIRFDVSEERTCQDPEFLFVEGTCQDPEFLFVERTFQDPEFPVILGMNSINETVEILRGVELWILQI